VNSRADGSIYLSCWCISQVQSPSIAPIAAPVKPTIQSFTVFAKVYKLKRSGSSTTIGCETYITNIVSTHLHFLRPAQPKPSNITSSPLMQAMQPQSTGGYGQSSGTTPTLQQQIQKPNYNISLPTTSPMAPMVPSLPASSLGGSFGASAMSSPPLFASPPAMRSMLAPSKPPQPSWNANKRTNNDWGDFDPLA